MGHAESPVLRIIGGAIRDEVRLLRQCVDVLTKLRERYVPVHGDTVAYDVQIGPVKVNDFFAAAILDICIANVPLARDRPIEDLCARRHLMRFERNVRTNFTQRLSDAIAGDAAANREYLSSKRENTLAYMFRDELFAETPPQIHDVAPDYTRPAPSASRQRQMRPSTRLRGDAVAGRAAIQYRGCPPPIVF